MSESSMFPVLDNFQYTAMILFLLAYTPKPLRLCEHFESWLPCDVSVQDTVEFALRFQTESPIKKGQYSTHDRFLHERVFAQVCCSIL